MKSSTLSIVAGVLALIGGVIALAFPLPAGLALTVYVGWALVLSGVFGLWTGFSDPDLPHRWWVFFFGLIEILLGIWILANPLGGLVSLTLAVGLLLILSGLGRFRIASATRGTTPFWLFVLSGVASVALGIYAIFAIASAAPILLGTLLAIELISVGATMVAMGIFLKRNAGL